VAARCCGGDVTVRRQRRGVVQTAATAVDDGDGTDRAFFASFL